MKRPINLALAAVFATLAASFALSGCASTSGDTFEKPEPNSSSNIAIVYANRANSGVALSDINELRDEIKNTVADEGFVAAVLADGKPQVVKANFELESQNGTRLENEVTGNVDGVLGMDYSAQTEECDLFDAIVSADRALGSAKNPDRKNKVYVIDSGISTAGPVNFSQPATRNALLDPESFAKELIDDGYLTTFQNINSVVWYGMGVASSPQANPVAGTVAAMQDLYMEIFNAAGVEDVTFNSATEAMTDASGLPAVSVVDMPRVSDKKLGDSLSLDERNSAFTFKSGSSEFNDPEAAKQGLETYIDQLLDFPDLKVVITGYTDTKGSEELNKALSKKRADAVKNLLVDSGVTKKQITTVGKGESSKYKTLKQNRRVTIDFK